MFSQLCFVRLRSAEKAMREGRIDEAYRIATAADLREQRRASDLLAGLAEKYVERARSHFLADRFTEALMDLDRAEAGGVLKEQITELRSHVQAVAAEERRKADLRQQRVQQAQRRIEAGSLAAGRRMLNEASDHDLAAKQLREAADHRVEEMSEILDQVRGLVREEQWAPAVARLRKAAAVDAHHPDLAKLRADTEEVLIRRAKEAFVEGRLARCADEIAILTQLSGSTPQINELSQAVATARDAGRCIATGQYAEARRHVLALERLMPDARWVHASVERVRELEELRTALLAGPLGDRGVAGPGLPLPALASPRAMLPGIPGALAARPAGLDDTVAVAALGAAGGLPTRLLLLVDGGGSYLLIRGLRATLGRAASDSPPDVPMFSDLAERHAEITRIEDDYFLISARDVDIGGRMTRHHLLRDGDRVVLGRKGKFTFRVPSRQSATAALDISDTTKVPHDVRRVLLFQQHATIGNGSTAHVRVPRINGTLVLFERGGTLWVRPKMDGHGDAQTLPMRLGDPVEIGGIRLVLQPWQVRAV